MKNTRTRVTLKSGKTLVGDTYTVADEDVEEALQQAEELLREVMCEDNGYISLPRENDSRRLTVIPLHAVDYVELEVWDE